MDLNQITDYISCLKMLLHESQDVPIPEMGHSNRYELKSSLFYFWVDFNRKGRKKPKCTLQLREQQHKDMPLLRLDILGPPHPNPPGDFPLANQVIPCPHIHISHPDYGDSIAYPLDDNYAMMFLTKEELEDLSLILIKFLGRCNVGNISDYNYEYQPELI